MRPERPCTAGGVRRILDEKHACEHAFGIAVEYRVPLAVRKCKDRAGRRASDARQRHELIKRGRELAAVTSDGLDRRAMKIAGPRVVAEARPQCQHVVERGRGQSCRIRKARHEALVIRLHRLDLGLLQHHFGNPDAIRRRLPLPGQVPAAVGFEPGQESCREVRWPEAHGVSTPPRSTRMTVSRSLAPATTASAMRISASMSKRASSATAASSVAFFLLADFTSGGR